MFNEKQKYEREKKTQFRTFNDGIVWIYKLADVSHPGFKPMFKPSLHKKYQFHYKTIGVRRNYDAMQAGVRLDEMIEIMQDRAISPQDIAVVNGVQYDIKQVQHMNDTFPHTSMLSLQRLEENYDDLEIR